MRRERQRMLRNELTPKHTRSWARWVVPFRQPAYHFLFYSLKINIKHHKNIKKLYFKLQRKHISFTLFNSLNRIVLIKPWKNTSGMIKCKCDKLLSFLWRLKILKIKFWNNQMKLWFFMLYQNVFTGNRSGRACHESTRVIVVQELFRQRHLSLLSQHDSAIGVGGGHLILWRRTRTRRRCLATRWFDPYNRHDQSHKERYQRHAYEHDVDVLDRREFDSEWIRGWVVA